MFDVTAHIASMTPRHTAGGILLLVLLAAAQAQAADLVIYEDALASGWDDWSWGTADSADTALKNTGASSLKVSYDSGWAGLSLRAGAAIDTGGYSSLRFYVYGRAGAGPLALYTQPTDGGAGSLPYVFTPAPNTWQQIDVPLEKLGNPGQIARLNIQNWSDAVPPAYNLDGLRLVETPLALTVDATASRHAISPQIYGINGYGLDGGDAAYMQSLGIPLRRLGGNNYSRYNWKLDASNTGNDWYFENVRMSDAANPPADSAANRFFEQNRQAGADTILTVPMTGFVAKDASSCGFSIAKYGPAAPWPDPNVPANDWEWRPDCGNGVKAVDANNKPTFVTGNNPQETSMLADPALVKDWLAFLARRYGKASKGGVRFYDLDNEMDIWWGTHRDVAPHGLKYEQLRDISYRFAAAVKMADSTAQTLGPVVNGWTYYWNSPYDGQREDWATPDDRNAHGGIPLVPWYLQQMRAYEQTHRRRILDYLDLHYYPAQAGVTLSPAGDAATQALRLNSTRSLWDPGYVDESWIADAGPDGGIVKLIPRMRDWVNNNYPGTKLAITEYNWGGHEHINGALAQADVLGIFGREGLDLATLWAPPKQDQPAAFAFRMYRNYDGAGAKFGETSVSAQSSAQGKLAVYAAEEAATFALTVMVINKTGGALSAPLSLAHFSPAGVLQGWRYSAAQLGSIAALPAQTFAGTQFTASYPANSLTLYRIPGKHQ